MDTIDFVRICFTNIFSLLWLACLFSHSGFQRTNIQNEDYHSVDWSIDLKDNEVFVVHILCVNPHMQKHALAKDVMDEIVQMAKTAGMKAIRLDALCCNKPAHILYEKCGFVKRGIQNWYADNTGWIDFFLYELVL